MYTLEWEVDSVNTVKRRHDCLRVYRAEDKMGLHLRTGSGPSSEAEAPSISRQSAQDGGKVVSPAHRPPNPQGISPVLISCRGWDDHRARIKAMKNQYDPIGNRSHDLPVLSATAYNSDIMDDGQIPKKEGGCCTFLACAWHFLYDFGKLQDSGSWPVIER
jgi:hypothetical protein